MAACKKTPTGTTVEVPDGTSLPVDGFGTIEVDLDQPGTTTKPVKMVSVTYMPHLSWIQLSTHKAMEQWGKPLVYYKKKEGCFRVPGGGVTCFKLLPPQGIISCQMCEMDPESRGSAGVGRKND